MGDITTRVWAVHESRYGQKPDTPTMRQAMMLDRMQSQQYDPFKPTELMRQHQLRQHQEIKQPNKRQKQPQRQTQPQLQQKQVQEEIH